MAAVSDLGLECVVKRYAKNICALDNVSMHVAADQCLALVGPSGCGKTTLLRLIAGLESPTSGIVRIGGLEMNGLPPHQRGVAMAFQTPALSPGQTVRQNLVPAWTSGDRAAIDEMADLLRIDGLLDRVVAELSGGEQQRVALGRALLRRAPVCLLDEPLGHLEAPFRLQLRRDLRLLSRRFPATMIHVTHDPAEALAVGDRVAVLEGGRLEQVGTPDEVVRRSASRFVAGLFRYGMCFVSGRLEGPMFVVADWLKLPVPLELPPGDVTLGVDAKDVRFGQSDDAVSRIVMDVVLTEYSQQGFWVTCRRDGVQLTGFDDRGLAVSGMKAILMIDTAKAFWFDTATGKTLRAPG